MTILKESTNYMIQLLQKTMTLRINTDVHAKLIVPLSIELSTTTCTHTTTQSFQSCLQAKDLLFTTEPGRTMQSTMCGNVPKMETFIAPRCQRMTCCITLKSMETPAPRNTTKCDCTVPCPGFNFTLETSSI